MDMTYNLIAGKNLDRLAALSDGIFAVAMTLLALDLRVPPATTIHSESDLWHALGTLVPRLIPYLMSFMTLGIFWVGQQTQLNRFARSNRNLAWIHLTFLLLVTLMPFSTGLLAGFIGYRVALLVYWLNILLLGVVLLASWRYALRAGLVTEETTTEMRAAMERRIVVAQSLYAIGAALCLPDSYFGVRGTYVSIGAIILVQLNYVIAPRIRPLYRL